MTRRKIVIIVSFLIIISTLFYVDNISIRWIKSGLSKIGVIDSQQVIVGVTDVRLIDHTRGNKDADIMLLEYSDLSCVLCAAMQVNFDRLIEEEGIRIISRHLYRNENNAFQNAIKSECVAKHLGDDAFFKFIRHIYDNRSSADDEELLRKAVELGLTPSKFNDCYKNDSSVRKRIVNDSKDALKLGARGTPYIVVVYKNKPVGISYANEYNAFLDRVRILVEKSERGL